MTSNFALNNVLTYYDRRLFGWAWVRGWFSFALASSIGAIANVGIATYLFAEQQTPWLLSAVAGVLVGVVLELHRDRPFYMETSLRPSTEASGIAKPNEELLGADTRPVGHRTCRNTESCAELIFKSKKPQQDNRPMEWPFPLHPSFATPRNWLAIKR